MRPVADISMGFGRMYSRHPVNRRSTSQRYVTRHPPRWVAILIDRYNQLDHELALGPKATGEGPRRVSIRQFVEMELTAASNRRIIAFHGLQGDWQPTADVKVLQQELDPDPVKKLEFFLKKVWLCGCGRAFWPPRSDSQICEKCKQYRKKLKALAEDLRAELVRNGWDKKAIDDELTRRGYRPIKSPTHSG